MSRVLIACGGTGGHVHPALAIAAEIHARWPEAAITFLGRPASFESEAIARAGYPMDGVDVGRLAGQGFGTRLRTLAGLPVAIVRAATIVRRRDPDVVIGTGGFVSAPAVLAAALLRVPTLVQEQNAVPGFTNAVLRRIASRVALAHAPAGGASGRERVTGNPVRPEFFGVADRAPSQPPCVLVLGGSQGARALNQAAAAAAARLPGLRMVISSGPRWEEETTRIASAQGGTGAEVEVRPYLHDMPARLAAASLVVSRSGASAVAEICAAGRPAILVPFPRAAGDHQLANARALEREGATVVIEERDLSPERLAGLVRELLAEPQRLADMAARARALARPDAAARIVDLAAEAASRHSQPRPAALGCAA